MIPKLVTVTLTIITALCIIVSLVGWIIPVEAVQNWAFQQVRADDVYGQFEAVGRAEAVWWLFAYAGPVLTVVAVRTWLRCERLIDGVQRLIAEVQPMLWDQTSTSWMGTATRWIKTGLLAATLLLAVFHLGGGVWDRIKDWPYYRLYSGDEMLPNISDANREVIRYLRSATPENSRIFVVSDQKLFFLSYYLYPRKILHRIHPDAEYLIPRAHQERQLAAYRLKELPADVLSDAHPDFVLEYFEGPEYVMPERNAEDLNWLHFVRQRQQNPNFVPPYTVVLRTYEEAVAP
ncbi:MAG: hypothetical protein WD065_04205 [Planctomycetaceae bacterium]